MRSLLPALAGVSLFILPLSAGAQEGQYRVKGTNPGDGSAYSGTVTVQRAGDTYSIVWQISGTRYVGTGIGGPEGFAVTYRAGNDTGVGIYTPEAGGYDGVWAFAGGRQIGAERWTR